MAYTKIDRELLKKCLTSEPGAWRSFVDRFVGLFIHVINHTASSRSVPLSKDDIDDLCAEIFLTLVKDNFAILRRFRGESSLATYLTVIARRVTVNSIAGRQKAKAMGHVGAYGATSSGVYAAATESNGVERTDNADLVQTMLEGLDDKEAAVVRMYHLEGKSYKEISKALKLPVNTIGPLLSRVRTKMKQKTPTTSGT